MNKLILFFDLFRKGASVSDPIIWKNRTSLTLALTALILTGCKVAKGFGYDLPISETESASIAAGVALPPLSVEEMRIRQYAEVPVPGAPTTVRPTLKQLAEFALAVMQLYAETERPTDANMADVENLAIEHNLLNEYGEVPLCLPEDKEPAPSNIHISESKSVAVSQDRYWQPMETCPRGVKVALLNPGKVAVFGQSHGHGGEPWLGWDPLPKVPDWMK